MPKTFLERTLRTSSLLSMMVSKLPREPALQKSNWQEFSGLV
jgi:hypothetical protein